MHSSRGSRTRHIAPAATALVVGLTGTFAIIPIASAAAPTCGGIKATIVGNDKDNVIKGTDKRDVIVAGAGNDSIRGLDGNDVICGGEGSDRIIGGAGNDVLYGELDAYWTDSLGQVRRKGDVIVGGAGDDTIDLGFDSRATSPSVEAEPDTVSYASAPAAAVVDLRYNPTTVGADGQDTLFTVGNGIRFVATDHNDTVYGTDGDDVLQMLDGDDLAYGSGGADTLLGDGSGPAGNDRLYGNAGPDRIVGAAGSDTLVGGTGGDSLTSTSFLPQAIRGGGGADVVTFPIPSATGFSAKGHGGPDRLKLMPSANPALTPRLRLDQGKRKTAIRGLTTVTLVGNINGFSDVVLPASTETVYRGTKESELITANPGFGVDVNGRKGSDVLIGSNLKDRLDGGKGFDIVRGKGGKDRCLHAERRTSC